MVCPSTYLCAIWESVWCFILIHWAATRFLFSELLTKHRVLDPTKIPKRTGQVAVVTGGSRGIGGVVVKKMLQCDMHVIIGCRNTTSGGRFVQQLRREGVSGGKTDVLELDLESYASVRAFAKQVLDKNLPIHILVNNAGIMFTPRKITADGFESQLQVNYLSHFLLTYLLLPKLKVGATAREFSRVVNVSSSAHFACTGINIATDGSCKDITDPENYDQYRPYANSKFLQVASSEYWNNKFKAEGVPIIMNSVHPGMVDTGLYENIFYAKPFGYISKYIFKTTEQGGDAVAFPAISPEIGNEDGGLFWANSQKCRPNPLSADLAMQQRLWEASLKWTGV